MRRFLHFLVLLLIFEACTSTTFKETVFVRVDADHSNVDFANRLTVTEEVNAYTYRNFYNGAGVAIGDINNDGLADIYLAGNQVDNKLYLNKGNLQFEDITASAGVSCENVWSTGVNMVDVNGDDLLDIYVCKSGPVSGPNRYNELFINNGDLTFTESAERYGIADIGLSNHAAFFDYDQDGDLDMYLLNNSLRSVGIYDLREGQREIRDTLGGNKLYRNEGDEFVDVSEQVGIYGSAIGFGLGVTIADLNLDGWMDIFVSNDFFERDYLYINQQDGTFSESLTDYLDEISMGSMGADIADINNDGLPDIYVTEMLPASLQRIKTKTVFEDWDKYQANVASGYHHQFTRNVLQQASMINGELSFSELGRLYGTHATDWSWGALIADLDNDGLKDIYVANGIGKDLMDHDYMNFYANNNINLQKYKSDSTLLTHLIEAMPSVRLRNHFFKNSGHGFEDVSETFGFGEVTFSNGAAYGDLDNDGDLDLVINNIDDEVFIYQNNTKNNYLKLNLQGSALNSSAIGAKVTVYYDENQQYYEHNPVKGYLSTMDHALVIGMGDVPRIDSLRVIWPDGSVSRKYDLETNQTLSLSQRSAKDKYIEAEEKQENPWLVEIKQSVPFTHVENDFIDFDRERLLYQMRSSEGPALAFDDASGNTIYLGGAKGSSGYFLTLEGEQIQMSQEIKYEGEDIDAVFVDLTGDGNSELYVVSGSNESGIYASELMDRVYLRKNDDWVLSNLVPSTFRVAGAFAAPIDYDKDGDSDMIIGERLVPGQTGLPGSIYLLENDGTGQLRENKRFEGVWSDIGMITDGQVVDFNKDGWDDLVVIGEYLPVTVFINEKGQDFRNATSEYGLEGKTTLSHNLSVADFNADGYLDLAVSNHGLNSRLKASMDRPLRWYINDFDRNGSVDQILNIYEGDKSYPMVMLHDLISQIPQVKKTYVKHSDYMDKSMEEIFDAATLSRSIIWAANSLESFMWLSDDSGGYQYKALPVEVQYAPMYASTVLDIDNDGDLDIIMGGNLSKCKPELGIYRASRGAVLKNDGSGNFAFVSPDQSGFVLKGEIRQIILVQDLVLVARTDDELKVYKRSK